jgi:UDP-glucose 4-epimerase
LEHQGVATGSLVTGGAGFIGSHVVDELITMGHDVCVLDDLSGGFRENVNPRAHFRDGSCSDATLITKLFDEFRFNYVFHLAAYAAEGLSHYIRRFNYTSNVVGSANVINECVNHGVQCVVFTSSIAVYGRTQVPMTESTLPEPEDPYGIAKYSVELDLAAARRLFGLNYIIFRPHNVYGERQNTADRYRNVIGIFMNQILHGQPCTVFGTGEQQRAFTYITDVATPIARSIDRLSAYGETFNLGADTPYTINRVLAAVQQAMGKDTGVVYHKARDEAIDAFADHTKARNLLGYRPRVTLEEGLARMARWAEEVGPRRAAVFGNIEIEKNLPEAWRTCFSQEV